MAENPLSPEEQARQRFRQDLAAALELGIDAAAFRRILWHLIDDPDWCRAHGLTSVHRHTGELLLEQQRIYFAEGRRSIGVEIEGAVKSLNPRAYMKMLNEQMGLRNQQPSAPVEVQSKK